MKTLRALNFEKIQSCLTHVGTEGGGGPRSGERSYMVSENALVALKRLTVGRRTPPMPSICPIRAGKTWPRR